VRRNASGRWGLPQRGVLAVLGAAACVDAGGVSPDAIPGAELAAVRSALYCAAETDPYFALIGTVVLPYVDRATILVSPAGDTTRVTGLLLDLSADDGSGPVRVELVGALAWTGFDSAAQTVDTTVLLLGTGGALPVEDSLAPAFSPAVAGEGSGVVIHSPTPATCQLWAPRGGLLRVESAGFDQGTPLGGGPPSVTLSRGTMGGSYTVTAKSVPDSASTIATGQAYPDGAQALRMRVEGLTLP
jgi:hypothetical protein